MYLLSVPRYSTSRSNTRLRVSRYNTPNSSCCALPIHASKSGPASPGHLICQRSAGARNARQPISIPARNLAVCRALSPAARNWFLSNQKRPAWRDAFDYARIQITKFPPQSADWCHRAVVRRDDMYQFEYCARNNKTWGAHIRFRHRMLPCPG